ncbi:MAG: serine O-acetyltransferase [Chloroflexi bacterium]|nr:serine O-acetyltransferase [Chloroflexota bacterium]
MVSTLRHANTGNGKVYKNVSDGLTIIGTFWKDIRSVIERDPAARNVVEIVLCYPGLHAVWGHRLTHWLWIRKYRLLARWLSQLLRGLTGIEIHPGAIIGPGLFIDHGMGVVIGETSEIGEDVTLYHGVTLGGTSLQKGKRHPTLGNRVVVGAGAKILGAITVGDNSRIGANAVVVKPVPPDSVVVGVPGQIVSRSKPSKPKGALDMDHTQLPDLVGVTLSSLIERVDVLEERLEGHTTHLAPHAPDHGVWRGEDFAI